MEQLPDARLVDQAKAGDQQAFAELYSRWFDSVYDFAARITRDYEEAAGIAHDTFLRAMNTLGERDSCRRVESQAMGETQAAGWRRVILLTIFGYPL